MLDNGCWILDDKSGFSVQVNEEARGERPGARGQWSVFVMLSMTAPRHVSDQLSVISDPENVILLNR